MTKYYVSGSIYKPLRDEDIPLCDSLPPAVYVLQHHPMQGFILEKRDSFTLPDKLYGYTTSHAERIMRTFVERPSSTGVMLVGEKGSGKTLLAKKLSADALLRGWPTVLINQPFGGDEFMSAIQAIDMPCVVLFDEFDKVYKGQSKAAQKMFHLDDDDGGGGDDQPKKNSQDGILTLLDGVFPSKKLFILTSNERHSFSSYLKNRPGRLFYHINYTGVDQDFIAEYCRDRLKNQDNLQGVVNLSYMFEHFNFDMLQALVEEMNRYSETAQQAVELLNINVFEDSFSQSYRVSVKLNGEPVRLYQNQETYFNNPLTQKSISLNYALGKPKRGGDNWQNLQLSPRDLDSINKEGVVVFKTDAGFEATFERKTQQGFSYTNFIERAF